MKTVTRSRSLAVVTLAYVIAVAVAVGWMFLGASIPMMETRSLQRRPEYQSVIDRVSRFVPRPPERALR